MQRGRDLKRKCDRFPVPSGHDSTRVVGIASVVLQSLTRGPLSADLTTCHNVRDQCSACHADQLRSLEAGQGMGHVLRRGLVDYVSKH
jgi:hypothetical protein